MKLPQSPWKWAAVLTLGAVPLIFCLAGVLGLLIREFAGIQLMEVALLFTGVVWIGIFWAIYHWRKSVTEFSESKDLFRHVLIAARHGILSLEAIRDSDQTLLDFKITVANQAAAEMLNLPLEILPESLLKNGRLGTWGSRLFDLARSAYENPCENAPAEDLVIEETSRWLQIQTSRLKNGVVLGFEDVTASRNTLDQLKHDEELLRIAGRMAAVGGWNVSFPSRTVTWSNELCRIYEMPADSQPSLDEILNSFLPAARATVQNAFRECAAQGIPYDLEVEMTTAKGRRIWVRGIGEAQFENGSVRRVYGTLQDITEAKKNQSRLEQALAQEHELVQKGMVAERAKSEFLAMMSHEIRTPMNGILGFAELLEQTPLPPESGEHVAIIHSSSRSLLRIIDDILDFSGLESESTRGTPVPFDPAGMLREITELFASQAREKGLQLKINIDADVPPQALGDVAHLRRILINLLGNALKFTESGTVSVSLHRDRSLRAETLPRFNFAVADSGPGISPVDLGRIFEPFVQTDNRIARRHTGTGLGLAISQRLAKVMDGRLEVTSTLGQGSTFTLIAPLHPTTILQAAEKESPENLHPHFADHHPLRILVADDEPVNLKLIGLVLRRAGYQPFTATNGGEAVELFKRERPNFILMDMQMPEMDGMEATRAIRQIERNFGWQPAYVSALTANVMPDDRQRCLDAGMNNYLSKPMNKVDLARMLAEAASSKTSS